MTKDDTQRMLNDAIEVYGDAARSFKQEEVEDAYANLWDAIDLHAAACVAEALAETLAEVAERVKQDDLLAAMERLTKSTLTGDVFLAQSLEASWVNGELTYYHHGWPITREDTATLLAGKGENDGVH